MHDRLAVHARDELGIDVGALARPVQASAVSAASFVVGALLPVLIIALAPASVRMALTVAATLVGLVVLGTSAPASAERRRVALRFASLPAGRSPWRSHSESGSSPAARSERA